MVILVVVLLVALIVVEATTLAVGLLVARFIMRIFVGASLAKVSFRKTELKDGIN